VVRRSAVPRPVRTTEYTIAFATRSAESGWRDLVATQRNAVATAWDRLSADPLTEDLACHALRGELGTVAHAGRSWTRRQIELKRGADLVRRRRDRAGRAPAGRPHPPPERHEV